MKNLRGFYNCRKYFFKNMFMGRDEKSFSCFIIFLYRKYFTNNRFMARNEK
jgi:hypothetical protein